MTPLLAQMMPGMEWIPVMLLLTAGGLLCGIISLLLLYFFEWVRASWKFALTATIIGITSPILFLILVGSNLDPIGYIILATPLIPGAIAVMFCKSMPRIKPQPRGFPVVQTTVANTASTHTNIESLIEPGQKAGQIHAPGNASQKLRTRRRRAISIVLPIGTLALILWVWNPGGLIIPKGVVLEEPDKYEADATATDPDSEQIRQAFKQVTKPGPVSIDMPLLDEFGGPNRNLLIRHMETSANWFVSRDKGKKFAYRRAVENGRWINTLWGYVGDQWGTDFNATRFQFRIMLELDGPTTWPSGARQTIPPTSSAVLVPVTVLHNGEQGEESNLDIEARGALLRLFEQSFDVNRPLTRVALTELNDEFRRVLASPVAKAHGFDPALMPKESIKRGPSELRLVDYGRYPRNLIYAYVNPGESGFVYLKIFTSSNTKPDELYQEGDPAGAYVGWSNDPQEQFFCHFKTQIAPWSSADSLPARLELWFAPDSGKPDRKLIEKYYRAKPTIE